MDTTSKLYTKDIPTMSESNTKTEQPKSLNSAKSIQVTSKSQKQNTLILTFQNPNLIKKFEGLRLKAYKCSAGVWTIGYGSTRDISGEDIKVGDTITLDEAEHLLFRDLESFCAGVRSLVKVELNQNQFDALVSLSYNIGLGNFSKSTLLKKLNAREYIEAADQFLLWRKAGGKIIKGLEKRRAEERKLFLA